MNHKIINSSYMLAGLKTGLAWHYKKHIYKQSYAELENVARNEKLGLWADNNPVAPWDYRRR